MFSKSYIKILRQLFAATLLIAFIFISAKPSFENFMSEKVITEISEIPEQQLRSPTLTICIEIVRVTTLDNYIQGVRAMLDTGKC